MAGNHWGQILVMTTFGESHGEALGVIVDGLPAGLSVDHKELQQVVDRRRPGQRGTTSRQESDRCKILSGIFEGKTTGAPVAVMVENHNQRSQDYDPNFFRVGHADRTTLEKYGVRDYRGGGRSSGRETVARVIAGYFAQLILPQITFSNLILNMGSRQN
jgi:chorismate synthase